MLQITLFSSSFFPSEFPTGFMPLRCSYHLFSSARERLFRVMLFDSLGSPTLALSACTAGSWLLSPYLRGQPSAKQNAFLACPCCRNRRVLLRGVDCLLKSGKKAPAFVHHQLFWGPCVILSIIHMIQRLSNAFCAFCAFCAFLPWRQHAAYVSAGYARVCLAAACDGVHLKIVVS